jgi:hypothetical protein
MPFIPCAGMEHGTFHVWGSERCPPRGGRVQIAVPAELTSHGPRYSAVAEFPPTVAIDGCLSKGDLKAWFSRKLLFFQGGFRGFWQTTSNKRSIWWSYGVSLAATLTRRANVSPGLGSSRTSLHSHLFLQLPHAPDAYPAGWRF